MEEKRIDEYKSLQIIEHIMAKTNRVVAKQLAVTSIVSGYISFILLVLVFIGHYFNIYLLKYSWVVLPFVVVISMNIINYITKSKGKSKNIIIRDPMGINTLWTVIWFVCIPLILMSLTIKFRMGGTMFVLIIGIGYLYTNIILKFKTGIILTVFGILIGFLSIYIFYIEGHFRLYGYSIVMSFILMSIIPGHMLLGKLNKKSSEEKKIHNDINTL